MNRPFNLDEAKAGHPLITRDGRPAKFLAHVPECDPCHRVVAHIEGAPGIGSFCEDGQVYAQRKCPEDLVMPQRKVVKWGNAFKRSVDGSLELHARWFDTAAEATNYFGDAGTLARVEFEE